jgi:ribosomal protein S18 acetylase RimI-like enzyme
VTAHAELPEVVSADPELLEAVRGIYESSFTPAERTDFAVLAEDVRRGGRRLFVTRGGDGGVAGFGITRPLEPPGAHMLEYFAVAEGRRGAGIGGGLLEGLMESLRESGAAAWMLFEVERPEDGAANAERRIAFYERHGARIVACAPDYRAPRLTGPGELRYLLMWAPLSDGVGEPRGDVLRTAVVSMLVSVYELDPGAPLVREVAEGLIC